MLAVLFYVKANSVGLSLLFQEENESRTIIELSISSNGLHTYLFVVFFYLFNTCWCWPMKLIARTTYRSSFFITRSSYAAPLLGSPLLSYCCSQST